LQLKWCLIGAQKLRLEIALHSPMGASSVGGHWGDKKEVFGDGPEAVN
jgi:hypothetical protein